MKCFTTGFFPNSGLFTPYIPICTTSIGPSVHMCVLFKIAQVRPWFQSFYFNSTSFQSVVIFLFHLNSILAVSWENLLFAYAKTKVQISCVITVQLISNFASATYIVQCLYFLNQKFQASTSRLVWNLVSNPEYRFSCDLMHIFKKRYIQHFECFQGHSRLKKQYGGFTQHPIPLYFWCFLWDIIT